MRIPFSAFQHVPSMGQVCLRALSHLAIFRRCTSRSFLERDEDDISLLGSMTQQVHFLQELEEEVRHECLRHLKYQCEDEGTTLFRQGDKGDSFYIILSGAVDVIVHFPSATGDMEEKIVATLKDGASFGELALVKSQPRNATIRTNTRCEIFRMDRAAYIRVLKSFHEEKHRYVDCQGRARSGLEGSE